LLEPLAESSKTAQLVALEGHHGALHTYLTTIEHLLEHLEASKNKQTYLPASYLKASVNLGWKKLNKYYNLSDSTLAYRLAVLLNLAFKMRWFDKK